MVKGGIDLVDIFDAAREAGRQLIKDGRMRSETLGIISRELVPLKSYISPN